MLQVVHLCQCVLLRLTCLPKAYTGTLWNCHQVSLSVWWCIHGSSFFWFWHFGFFVDSETWDSSFRTYFLTHAEGHPLVQQKVTFLPVPSLTNFQATLTSSRLLFQNVLQPWKYPISIYSSGGGTTSSPHPENMTSDFVSPSLPALGYVERESCPPSYDLYYLGLGLLYEV